MAWPHPYTLPLSVNKLLFISASNLAVLKLNRDRQEINGCPVLRRDLEMITDLCRVSIQGEAGVLELQPGKVWGWLWIQEASEQEKQCRTFYSTMGQLWWTNGYFKEAKRRF
jgi:hypothetical protein